MDEVKLKYGTWEKFQLIDKQPNVLYFLDNHQVYKGTDLLTNIHTVMNGDNSLQSTDEYGFPDSITPDMRENYYISFNNGEIRYVTDDLEYISITELQLNDILVNQDFLQQLIAAIADTQEVVMPTLTVDNNTLIWTGSNVDSITVFIPKQ